MRLIRCDRPWPWSRSPQLQLPRPRRRQVLPGKRQGRRPQLFLKQHGTFPTLPPTYSPRLTGLPQKSSRHHEHRHAALTLANPGHDLGILGVILHVVGDAVNNIGVMVVAIAIWKAESEARFYADPAVSLFIAVMIFLSAFPLVKNSGLILLQSAPLGVDLEDIKHDLEKVSRFFKKGVGCLIKDNVRFMGVTANIA